MALTALAVLAVAIVVVFAALRDDENLSVQAALAETRAQGFDAVIWRASPEMRRRAEQFEKITGKEVGRFSGDGHVILLRGRQITDLKQPVAVVWFPSADAAAARVQAGRPLFEGRLSEDEKASLPRDFEVRRLREERVCNLVLTSYDDGSDGGLSARFSRLLEAMRSRCS